MFVQLFGRIIRTAAKTTFSRENVVQFEIVYKSKKSISRFVVLCNMPIRSFKLQAPETRESHAGFTVNLPIKLPKLYMIHVARKYS